MIFYNTLSWTETVDSKGKRNKKDTMEIVNVFSSCLYYFHSVFLNRATSFLKCFSI